MMDQDIITIIPGLPHVNGSFHQELGLLDDDELAKEFNLHSCNNRPGSAFLKFIRQKCTKCSQQHVYHHYSTWSANVVASQRKEKLWQTPHSDMVIAMALPAMAAKNSRPHLRHPLQGRVSQSKNKCLWKILRKVLQGQQEKQHIWLKNSIGSVKHVNPTGL